VFEGRDVAIFRRQSLVHKDKSHWRNCQQDPQTINKIEAVYPEGHDDTNNGHVVQSEEGTPEANVGKISFVSEQLTNENETNKSDKARESQWNCGTFLLLLWGEVIGDLIVHCVI